METAVEAILVALFMITSFWETRKEKQMSACEIFYRELFMIMSPRVEGEVKKTLHA